MQRLAILGSTGSIGENTLKVVRQYPKHFKVVALTAYANVKRLAQQAQEFKPAYVAVHHAHRDEFKKFGIKGVKVLTTDQSSEIAAMSIVDTVVLAMRGAGALMPFLGAVRAGKKVAPANKEALVIAGELIMTEARKNHATVIPVDSEQSAIFQCIDQQRAPLSRVHLTASGGCLHKVARNKFDSMTVEDILRHPRWKMGPGITVDSATLMNKGFEVIEAMRLFNLTVDQVKVVIHPEAIIHSMVEFADGSLLAQFAVPDMRLPIQYALTYPLRLPCEAGRLDLVKIGQLNFLQPDVKKFPSLALAFDCAARGGSKPVVLNAANEVAVEAFLAGRIKLTDIYHTVEKLVSKHQMIKSPSLEDILAIDQTTRCLAKELIG